MLLSELVGKKIYSGTTRRGICLGVAISLKSYAVKYLLCSSADTYNPLDTQTDFAINLSAVTSVNDGIFLSRLRPVFPKNVAKIFIHKPIYSNEGVFIGNVADMEMDDFIAVKLLTNRGEAFPLTAISAFSDAVILRKRQPYPIGQRIPITSYSNLNERIVTKSVLRSAIENRALIRLTLSLPPFYLENR